MDDSNPVSGSHPQRFVSNCQSECFDSAHRHTRLDYKQRCESAKNQEGKTVETANTSSVLASPRDVGGYLGLQPGRRKSGESEPQLHISKEGDPYLRTLLVQGAQHILGPFGIDCDLRRWGLKLAERGGRNGKKRAIVATARKLAVLLHHLWVSGEVYEPLHNSNARTVAAAA